jgi:hypothetical protein
VPLGLLVPTGDEPAGGAVVRRCCSAEVRRGRGRGAGSGDRGNPSTAWGGVAVAGRGVMGSVVKESLTVDIEISWLYRKLLFISYDFVKSSIKGLTIVSR